MAKGDIGTTYDIVAQKYEQKFANELDNKPRDRDLLTSFAESTNDPIVEIGCGPGHVGAFVRRRGRRVVGLDLSFEMAGLALTRLDAAAAAAMRHLPIASATVGGLLAFYSIIHVERAELDGVLEEMRRVLRADGGRLILSAHQGSGNVQLDEFLGERVPFGATFYDLAELAAAVDRSGLRVVRAEQRAPYATESGTNRLYVEAIRSVE